MLFVVTIRDILGLIVLGIWIVALLSILCYTLVSDGIRRLRKKRQDR